jgi:hypothetical protein
MSIASKHQPNPGQQELALKTAECDQLRAELAKVSQERDDLLRAVYALLPAKQFDYTKEQLFAEIGKNKPLPELLAELRAEE